MCSEQLSFENYQCLFNLSIWGESIDCVVALMKIKYLLTLCKQLDGKQACLSMKCQLERLNIAKVNKTTKMSLGDWLWRLHSGSKVSDQGQAHQQQQPHILTTSSRLALRIIQFFSIFQSRFLTLRLAVQYLSFEVNKSHFLYFNQ